MKQREEKSIYTAYFKAFYLRHAGDMIFFARRFVDSQAAEDIVHDIFLKIWDKRMTIIAEDNMRNYLFSMLRRTCYDYLKHRQVEETFIDKAVQQIRLDELKYYESLPDDFLEKNKMETIYTSIEKLPSKRRDIFKKAYLQGKKHNDIAKELHISVRTVETQIYKALKFLRDNLVFLSIFGF